MDQLAAMGAYCAILRLRLPRINTPSPPPRTTAVVGSSGLSVTGGRPLLLRIANCRGWRLPEKTK
jgi:hypothetical protein